MACLELDQPIRAGGYAKQIKNWRRGACYADLAFYCAQHGFTEKARHYLTLAEEESEKAEDWRRDRIRVKIARAYTLLGQNTQAEEFASNVVESETGKAADAKAIAGNKKSFDAQMEELDRLIAKGDFDILKNVHHACAQLFNQYYEDHEKRDQAEQKIKTTWNKLPIIVRLQSLMELAEFALDHGDQAKALELVDEIQQPLDDCQWPLEHYLALIGKTERLRGLAGDQDGARKILGSALERYDADGETIVNIFRAEALVPLAEAYQAMGDAESAQTVYAKAIEAGMINPNSRPRAEDLSATCVSMAANAFEPSEELRTRIHQISSEELGNPW
ncbi:hypothetical protein JXA32_00425 [Candidatus Sumerlaeota bacterium]|nr:hypothetical protein [Candidatus Sumerlaeota bacterium]